MITFCDFDFKLSRSQPLVWTLRQRKRRVQNKENHHATVKSLTVIFPGKQHHKLELNLGRAVMSSRFVGVTSPY